MMVSKSTLDSCREYLRVSHIFVKEEWLTEAIEYFINGHGEEDLQKIHTFLIKQWYLNDLTEISSGCNKLNLKPYKTKELTGHYMLQINCITSFEIFDQHKVDLKRYIDIKEMENAAESQDMHRLEDKMLQLYMTDGVQEVIGIVLKPITNLSITTVPGVKVLIKGVVKSYGGFLILSNDNCHLLGGEVENLLSDYYEHVKNLVNLVKQRNISTT